MKDDEAHVERLIADGKLTPLTDDENNNFKGRIIIYSITGCPHCRKAKGTLKSLNIPFYDVNLDIFPVERPKLKKRFDGNPFTVPQIFFNNRHIGGNSEFQQLVAKTEEFEKIIKNLIDTEPDDIAPQLPDPKDALVEVDIEDLLECSHDEFGGLMLELVDSSIVNKSTKSFDGATLVTWLCQKSEIDRARAVEIGTEMLTRFYIVPTAEKSGSCCGGKKQKWKGAQKNAKLVDSPNVFYGLITDELDYCMNVDKTSVCEPLEAGILGKELRQLMLTIYERCLSADGKSVDYECMKKGPQYKSYLDLAARLQTVVLAGLKREEQLSFWINVYNAMVIHATIVYGRPKNMFDRTKFFSTPCYAIGGHSYTMNQIENGVLRSNQRPPAAISPPFKPSDPRIENVMAEVDPRIHSALNCGAKSCPPIKTYSTDGIDEQLDLSMQSFLLSPDGLKLKPEKNEIHLSKIFSWYKVDFGNNMNEVVEKLITLGPDSLKEPLAELLKNNAKIVFMPYDWGSNEKKKD